MPELSEEQLNEFMEIFRKYDKDGNDSIDWDEFRLLIDELVGEMSLHDKARAFDMVDTNHSGRITFDEFIDWWVSR